MPEQTHSFVGFPLFSTGIPLVKQHCDELLDDYQEASVERRRSLWRNELCLAGHSSYLLGFSSQLLGSDHSSQFCFASHLLFFTVARIFFTVLFFTVLFFTFDFCLSCFLSQLLLLTAAFIHSCLADHSLQFCFSFQCFPSQLLFFIIVAFPRHSAFLHRCFSSSQLLFFTVAWPTTVHSDFSAGSKCVLCTTPSAQWKSFEKPIKTSFITLSQKGGRWFKTVPNSFFLKC